MGVYFLKKSWKSFVPPENGDVFSGLLKKTLSKSSKRKKIKLLKYLNKNYYGTS